MVKAVKAMTSADMEKIAGTLWEARVTRKACDAPTMFHPEMALEDAYRISRINFQRRVREGTKAIGHKVGLTSPAVQKQLGVDQPDFGHLTADMALVDGGAAPRGSWIQAKVEGEVAFVLKKDLRGPGVGREEVLAAADFVTAAIEIIDSRVRDWKIKIQDTVADNASSAAFVLGRARRRATEADLPSAGMTLWKNGEVASTGKGTACLGDPVNAVAWLANTFGALGETLRAGDVILSGAYGPVVPFSEGDRCEVEIEGLGRVSCSYDA